MAISYPLNFPDNLGISSFRLNLRVAVTRSESPFSFVDQVVRWSGQVWEMEIGLPNMFRDDAEEFNAFLLKLCGSYGTFLMGDPNGVNPRGSWAGTPVVDGIDQMGHSLNIKGLTPSTANIGRVGDYIQLGTGGNSRLHKLLEDVDSDADGKATLTLSPSLRYPPPDEQAIIFQNARGLFRLSENVNGFSINDNSIYGVSFKAIETVGIASGYSGNYFVDPEDDVLVEPA